jgi:glutaredoxin
MELEKPKQNHFTIYSKSGCKNCVKVKNFLSSKQLSVHIIDCDDYLIESKIEFLAFIKEYTKQDVKQFPIVFSNNTFIGGYDETVSYINKLNELEESCFSNI